MQDKWVFSTLQLLRITHPVWQEWWFARVWTIQYIWNNLSHIWESRSWIVNWWDILWTITNQSDLIAYIAAQISLIDLNKYPVDYISPSQTVTIEQYENYAIYSPLVNDWIFINDWSLIIN